MLLQTIESQHAKRKRGLAVLHERSGLEQWVLQPEAPQTLTALEVLVLNEAEDRAPGVDGQDVDSAFVRRVVSKLKYVLRHLGDLDVPLAKREAIFIRSVAMECKRTNRERGGRFLDPVPKASGQTDMDQVPGPAREEAEHLGVARPAWWRNLKAHVPSRLAGRAAVLASCIEGHGGPDAILTSDGELDVERISTMLGCSHRETKKILGLWQREVETMVPNVPRKLTGICRKLETLLSTPFDGLADRELRERLFDISRSLAASFGSVRIRARVVHQLDLPGFDESIDLLLDERGFSDSPTDRATLERLIQSLSRIRDAINEGNMDRAFAHSAALVVDVARLQHHTSQERLQVVLAYSHFLFVAGECDAFYEINKAIEERTEALAVTPGAHAWDRSPEFSGGETFRRIRTYARLNQVTCLFYRRFTTAAKERFQVRSVDQLSSLDDLLSQAAKDDPKAKFLYEELLVLRAHLVRAGYNQERRAKKTEKSVMREQQKHFVEQTRALVQNEFTDRYTGLPDVQRIIGVVRTTAEGCAVERTLDVLEELFSVLPDTADQIARERAARIRLCL